MRSILDINQTPAKRVSHIQSDQIDVSVDPATKSPLIASAQGRVILTSEEPVVDKSGKATVQPSQMRRLEASCGKAVYNVTLQRIVLDGSVIGRLTDRTLLAEPCDIRADTATIGLQSPYSTLVLHDALGSGAPPAADVRLALLLKPAAVHTVQSAKPPPKLPARANPFMRMHLYRFHDAQQSLASAHLPLVRRRRWMRTGLTELPE